MAGWFGTVLGKLADKAGMPRFTQNGLPLISKDSIRETDLVYPASGSEYEELVSKRKSVQRGLTREIDGLLNPLGYERKNGEWRKRSLAGINCFGLQKSTYGFYGFFNAGALGAFEAPNRASANTEEGISFYRMANFCPEMPYNDVADGLSYSRLHDDPEFRNGVMTVLRARMVPWMEVRHRRAGFIGMPSPSVMGSVRIFSELK